MGTIKKDPKSGENNISRRKKVVKKVNNSLEKVKKYIGKWKKYLVMLFGIVLIAFSVWFWRIYGLRGIIPPVTSIVIIAGVISMWALIKWSDIRKNVFGNDETDARKLLLEVLGTIFMGFVLMITILWGLMDSEIELHLFIVYIQSFFLVLLFFFFVSSFYCILTDLKQ